MRNAISVKRENEQKTEDRCNGSGGKEEREGFSKRNETIGVN